MLLLLTSWVLVPCIITNLKWLQVTCLTWTWPSIVILFYFLLFLFHIINYEFYLTVPADWVLSLPDNGSLFRWHVSPSAAKQTNLVIYRKVDFTKVWIIIIKKICNKGVSTELNLLLWFACVPSWQPSSGRRVFCRPTGRSTKRFCT